MSVERWCRLRGNLLFHFKSRDQWSEPAGVIVLENLRVVEDNTGMDGTFGISLNFSTGPSQHLGFLTINERNSWKLAIESSSYQRMRLQLSSLRDKIAARHVQLSEIISDSSVIDPCTPALLECSLSCDNLLCDALGRSPSPRLLVFLRNSDCDTWTLYANTEVVEVVCKIFLRIIYEYVSSFREAVIPASMSLSTSDESTTSTSTIVKYVKCQVSLRVDNLCSEENA